MKQDHVRLKSAPFLCLQHDHDQLKPPPFPYFEKDNIRLKPPSFSCLENDGGFNLIVSFSKYGKGGGGGVTYCGRVANTEKREALT